MYFGEPVDVDGVMKSCIDAVYDMPQDRRRLVALHPNLSDADCDPFIEYCQKNGFFWERGAKQFYVSRQQFPALQAMTAEIGIEVAYGIGVLADMID
jgi:hypothetical protein